MRIDLNQVSTDSLQAACSGLNAVLDDLKDNLGDARFSNEFYIAILKVSSLLDGEYFRREREKEGL